ncbi:hypothetical protein F2Q70_00004451 [Brassica cretica]|uniref:Uncharacterized protein n=1 Tax=Brassica cretica TaxID=69181 RepID=A0A8S9IM28_BRACR|nr:hypothetical protein F2Q70_00004451 [Brassica cretica]
MRCLRFRSGGSWCRSGLCVVDFGGLEDDLFETVARETWDKFTWSRWRWSVVVGFAVVWSLEKARGEIRGWSSSFPSGSLLWRRVVVTSPSFVEILSARVVLASLRSWSWFHGVALLVIGSLSFRHHLTVAVYTVPGLRGWRQQSPDSYPERRHRRLWTLSRAAGGPGASRYEGAFLSGSRQLGARSAHVSAKDPVLQGMRAPFSPARGNWELDPLMSLQRSVTAALMSVPFWIPSSFLKVHLL